MVRKHVFAVAVVVLLVVSLLPFTFACGPAPQQAAKPAVFEMYSIFDLSGPYATIMAAANDAFNDACEYANQQGGIKGVPVRFVAKDTGSKVDLTISHYEAIRVQKPKPLVLFLCVTGDGEVLHDRVCEDQIVAVATPSQKSMYPACYSFGWWPLYDEQFGTFIDWLKKNWKESRPPRVAFLTWDTAFGRACLTDAAMAYAKKQGVEIVAQELFGIRDMDVSTQLLRIKEKNPDWIWSNTLTHGPVVIMKSAQTLGYKIKLAGDNGIGEDAIAMGGPQLLEGVVCTYNQRTWDETNQPSIKILDEWFVKKNRPAKNRVQMARNPWFLVLTAVEVVGRAVDKVGWDRLDGPAVKEQYSKLKNFEPLQGLTKTTYSEQRRSMQDAFIVEIRGGKILPISDWVKAPDFSPAVAK